MRAGGAGHALAVAVAAGVALAIGPAAWDLQLAVALPLILVLGVPHGAADLLVADRWLAPPGGRAAFVAGYLGVAATAVAVWLHHPAAALGVFLLVSALHFAATDRAGVRSRLGWLPALALGTIPIAGPAWIHPQEVSRLFALLLPGPEGGALASGLQRGAAAAFPPACALLALAGLREIRLAAAGRGDLRWCLAGPALVLAAAAPPLLGFAVYFCCWHAPLHNAGLLERLREAGEARPLRLLLRGMLAPWVATAGLAAAAAALLPEGPPEHTAIRIAFVGLAALTLPHVVLWAWDSRGRRTLSAQPS